MTKERMNEILGCIITWANLLDDDFRQSLIDVAELSRDEVKELELDAEGLFVDEYIYEDIPSDDVPCDDGDDDDPSGWEAAWGNSDIPKWDFSDVYT